MQVRSTFARAVSNNLKLIFAALAPQLSGGAERQAIWLLHGMVQELWRGGDFQPGTNQAGPHNRGHR